MREYADSAPQAGEVAIRNLYGAEKHGTMLSFWRGYGNQRGHWDDAKKLFLPGGVAWNYPIGLGNMAVGEITAVGAGAQKFRVGDRVLYYVNFRPSAVRRETDLWKLSEKTAWRAAVCLDPLFNALAGVRDGNVRVGDAVVIIGLGAIGLMAVQAARIAGAASIIAIDPLANRRAIAAKTGADLTLDPTAGDAGLAIRDATANRGADVVIEYSGSVPGLQTALRGVAYGGTVVMGAFPGPYKEGLDFGAEAHLNRPNFIFSRADSEPFRDYPRWDGVRLRLECLRLIERGAIDGASVVTPVVKFSEKLPDAYREMAEHPETHVKMGVAFE
jgi:threonine dehydrogenase-like Zn-dependent dehydrogenase